MDAERLAHAVSAAACGDYAMAQRILEVSHAGEGPWRSASLSLLGSCRRQIGAVGEARTLDEAALRCAGERESTADALIGLAADAIASGDPAAAEAAHVEAKASAVDWRTRTRWHWVGAELGLLSGNPVAAADHASAAVASCAGRSMRHEAKSAIVRAATVGDATALPATLVVVRGHGWNTLIWPLALVAADHPAGLDAAWRAAAWAEAARATLRIEDCLPPDLRPTWRGQPGVQRLRAAGPLTGGE